MEILPTPRVGSREGCFIGVVLAHLLTSYIVLVLPAALGTLAFLHRALDLYERIEWRKQRRVHGGGHGTPGVGRRPHRP
jgi:hypothetical protein